MCPSVNDFYFIFRVNIFKCQRKGTTSCGVHSVRTTRKTTRDGRDDDKKKKKTRPDIQSKAVVEAVAGTNKNNAIVIANPFHVFPAPVLLFCIIFFLSFPGRRRWPLLLPPPTHRASLRPRRGVGNPSFPFVLFNVCTLPSRLYERREPCGRRWWTDGRGPSAGWRKVVEGPKYKIIPP